ncbi:M42 family metallopeptidase [Alkaliphilus hydrothermalis]|uniref:Endoglucanase n=1 Tax=Alkaliphilus hydrothermalis TaxID=1482730 RepID=A0ABS2NME3_9FIRM|nr:M42 family metallopeptidase [Alkaliphilus hydrothermalis]MBM7614103.1 endoglucanase [Alkaliphilus hydrothermalis]
MYTLNKELLKKLCTTYSPAGNEEKIRSVIESEVKDLVDEVYTDALGNLIAHKKGNGKKLMLSGHMDHIGLMVTYIDDKGFLRFANIGGISPSISVSQRVIFENGTIGVIGTEKLDSIKDLSLDKLFIDIGASSKEEAEEMISIGDVCVYYSECLIDDKKVFAPAMDDRIGCFVMIETLKQMKESKNDLYFVFSVQEEVGLRGAKTAAYGIDPDFGIALDVTATGDTPKGIKMAVKLGAGPAIKIKDNSVLCHPKVKNFMIEQAKKNDIPYQLEVLEFGGTDSGAIHLTKSGVPSGVLSIPTRYIHSTNEMCAVSDIENSIKLLVKLVENEIE